MSLDLSADRQLFVDISAMRPLLAIVDYRDLQIGDSSRQPRLPPIQALNYAIISMSCGAVAKPRPFRALFFNYLPNFCGVVKEAVEDGAGAAAGSGAGAEAVNEPTLLC